MSDEKLKDFLVHGYVVLETLLDEDFHDYVRDQTESYFDGKGDRFLFDCNIVGTNPGNNVIAYFPALQQVIEDPVVDGALKAILGDNYELHPHRHLHRTFPGRDIQSWHRV